MGEPDGETTPKNTLRSKKKSGTPKNLIRDGQAPCPAEPKSSDTHLDLIVEGLLNAEDPLDYFEDLKIIGHGGTAEVYKATRKSDGTTVALKKFRQDSPLEEIANELRTLRLCAHKHINGYVEGFIWENRVFLCLAYCVGSLTDILHIFKESFQEREIAAVAKHCLEALDHIHTKCNTVHRDIKANNVLLSADGSAMVGDFGISKVLQEDQKASTFIGSPYWMAPEVILAMETGTYSYAVDVWSLGITLIELAETKPPLFELHAMSACYHIANNPPPRLADPQQWSAAFSDFLSHCLVASPDERWSTKQLLDHEFISTAGSSTESKRILKDLIRRSRMKRAEVNGVDLSSLTQSGLLSNASGELENLTEVGEGDRQNNSARSTVSEQPQVEDVAAPSPSPEPVSTPPTELPPLRGQTIPAPPPRVASAIAEVQASLLCSAAPVTPVDGSKTAEGPKNTASPRPDDTIKLPNLLAAEEAHALGRESMDLKRQMKEISKLRAKHTEELRRMTERHATEVQTMVKSQEVTAATLKRAHEAALKEHSKETAAGLGKLHKSDSVAVKRVEDELRKTWTVARKELKSGLKQELKTLKKQHAKELGKAALDDMRETYRARRQKDFDDKERRCYTLELAALKCAAEIQESEFKIERVRSEFALRDKQLKESCELLWEHRTGQICQLQRGHLKTIHDKRGEQQRERHETIEKQLLVEHVTGVEQLQRRQRTISKKVTSTLKKVTPMDEEVVRKYASQQKSRLDGGEGGDGGPASALNIDDLVGHSPSKSSRASKKMASLSKEARKGLKAAREEHIREQTLKLNDDHLRVLDLKMKLQAKNLEELRHQHAIEGKMLQETLKNEVEEFDRKIEKIRTSTEQYNNMEKMNLSASKKDGMKKPFKKNAESIEVQRKLLDSTIHDLRGFYEAMEGRGGVRPLALNEISVKL